MCVSGPSGARRLCSQPHRLLECGMGEWPRDIPHRCEITGVSFMHFVKGFSVLLSTIALIATLGCASTRTHEGTGEYVDDSVITTKVKAAFFNERDLNRPRSRSRLSRALSN